MAETANIAVIDGESIADVSPWEFDSITEEVGNGFELSSEAAIHGLKGYKVSFGGVNDAAYGIKTFAEKDDVFARAYFNIPSVNYPNSTDADLVYQYFMYFIDGVTSVATIRLYLNQDNHKVQGCSYKDDGGTVWDDVNVNLSLGSLHYIDMHYKNGAGTGEYQVWLDGVSISSAVGLTISYKPDSFRIGNIYAAIAPANGEYFYIDDILISTTGPLGSYKKWWAPIVESDTIAGLATAAETELNDNYTLTSGTVPQIAAYRGLENNFQGCLLFHGQEV